MPLSLAVPVASGVCVVVVVIAFVCLFPGVNLPGLYHGSRIVPTGEASRGIPTPGRFIPTGRLVCRVHCSSSYSSSEARSLAAMAQPGTNPAPRRVYVAAMNLRGAHAPWTGDGNPLKINVTSAQSKTNVDRHTFSPMHVIGKRYVAPDGEYACFEHYWQSLKVYDHASYQHSQAKRWWQELTVAKRRWKGCSAIKKSTGRPPRVLHAIDSRFSVPLDYIESRKKIYVKDYMNMIRDKPRTKELVELVAAGGEPVIIRDFDGPREADGSPTLLEVSPAMLTEKINDASFPFGHGYVVAAHILGIAPEEYTL